MKRHRFILLTLLAIPVSPTRAQIGLPVRTVVQTGHMAPIIDYDISADSRFAATLDKNGQAILWNMATGHQFRELGEAKASEVYFNSRSTALVVVGRTTTSAYDIATGQRIAFWQNSVSVPGHSYNTTKPNERVEALKVKRQPSKLRAHAEGATLRVTDAGNPSRMVAEFCGKADAVHYAAPSSWQGRTADTLATRWWVGAHHPQQWDLSQGHIVGRIDFTGLSMADSLWRDAQGNLVFLDRAKGQLHRHAPDDGQPIDRISLEGEGRLHGLAFTSDNQTAVYDRNNQIWQTNLKKHKSKQLPAIDYQTKRLITERHGSEQRFREINRTDTYAPGQSDARVVAIGACEHPDSFFVLLNGVYGPMVMRLGNCRATLGGNAEHPPRKLIQHGQGIDMLVTTESALLLYRRQIIGEFEAKQCSSASIFGSDKIALGSNDGTLAVFDAFTGRQAELLHPHKTPITSIANHPYYPLAMTTADDGTVGVISTDSCRLVATLISCNEGRDYILRTPDNYYMSSRYGTEAIHFAVGSDTYLFDQFDLKYNRPDIVLQRLGLASQQQVQMLHRAYEKRLRRMHFTEDMLATDFHVPTLQITNVAELQNARQPQQTLSIDASDTKYRLNRINVWVNGVPVLGTDGHPVAAVRKLHVDLPLTLASGHNSIQVSCLNEKGAESFRQSIEVNLPTATHQPDLWVAVMGASDYADSRFNLRYAAKDATDIVQALQAVNHQDFANIHTLALTNNEVTREQLPRIREFFEKAGRDDTAILFYAGHGMVDSSLDYYLATYDTDFSEPSRHSLPYDEVALLLDGIAPLNKLLLIDACHSGEIDKEDIALTNNRRQRFTGDITFRDAGSQASLHEATLGAQQLNAVLTENFCNLQRGTGATVISSSSALQVAVEGQQWQNGLFSYTLMQGFRDPQCDANHDGRLNVSELLNYCQQQVEQLSGGRQQPTSRSENRMADFFVGRIIDHQP